MQYRSGSGGSGSARIVSHRPKRTSTCRRIAMNPSAQSAIGIVSTRSRSSEMMVAISSAASSAASNWPMNIAPYTLKCRSWQQ